MIAESAGEVAAQIAQVTAEIERQRRARAADAAARRRRDPARLARQRAAEEQARGEAAKIIERGRAEAGSLALLLGAYQQGGDAARDVLVLQKLLPMLGQITGSNQPLRWLALTVLPATQNGSDVARLTISAAEQLRAVTGVDVAQFARGVSARLDAAPATAHPKPPNADADALTRVTMPARAYKPPS